MKNNLTTFNALKKEMKSKGITQQQVSQHLNVQDRYLWKTIREGSIRQKTLEDICKFLDMDLLIVSRSTDVLTQLTNHEQ